MSLALEGLLELAHRFGRPSHQALRIPLRFVLRVTPASRATWLIPPVPLLLASVATYSRHCRSLSTPCITLYCSSCEKSIMHSAYHICPPSVYFIFVSLLRR